MEAEMTERPPGADGTGSAVFDPVTGVHRELMPFVQGLPAGPMSDKRAAKIRQLPVEPEVCDLVDRSEHVAAGDPPVRLRVHRPRGAAGPLPCVYSVHGGGLVIGTYYNDDVLFNRLCPKLGLVGVSVDYRLAPGTRYPGAIEDCYRGLEWTFEHADELGIDRDRVGVRGSSAGGGLAAALALMARGNSELPLRFQLLEAPMLDDRQITQSSRTAALTVWSQESNAYGWRSYLGDLYGTGDVPATAAAARAEDLSGLPATLITVGGRDGFLDEDADYALRLTRAGVPTELHVYPGACHGYQLARVGEINRQHNRDVDDWLARQIRL